jgi:hypothetical protein
VVGESFNWSTFGVVDGGQYSGDLVRVTGKGLEGCFTLDSEPGSTLERAMAGAMGGGPMSLSSGRYSIRICVLGHMHAQ